MPRSTLSFVVSLFIAGSFIIGCSESNPSEPPEGWVTEGDRWWDADADTAGVFRDLSSIDAMDIQRAESDYGRYVQDRLEPLYVSNPDVLDSLYGAVVAPAIEEANREGRDATSVVEELKRETYKLFRQPVADPADAIEVDVPSDFPGGRSVIVVHVVPEPELDEGEEETYPARADAVWVVESVSPEVDAQLMAHAARRKYFSGYVITDPRTNASRRIGGWIRLGRTFE